MNSDTLKDFALDTAKTTASIMLINMAGVPQLLKNNLPKSAVPVYSANGAVYALARSGADMITTGSSKVQRGEWLNFVDDVAFFGITSAVANETRAIDSIVKSVSTISPLGLDMNISLAEGGIVSGATMIANILDVGTGQNKVFDFIRRPISTIMSSY